MSRGEEQGPPHPSRLRQDGDERDTGLRRSPGRPRAAGGHPRALRLRHQGAAGPARADHQPPGSAAGRGGGAALRPARDHPGRRPARRDPAPLGRPRPPAVAPAQGPARAGGPGRPRGAPAPRSLLPRATVPARGPRGAAGPPSPPRPPPPAPPPPRPGAGRGGPPPPGPPPPPAPPPGPP